MKKLIFTLFALFSFLYAKPQAMIIFDASGSMWGQIGGVAKITIAKKALEDVVNGWNENVDLGLTVYGHRKKGDCSDIERVIPISKLNKSEMISTVKAISPKGKTPIARSLKQVASKLRGNEDETTIILISDGKESCDPNPCQVAKQLKDEGIKFVAHVIGFNVDKATDKQLACIANATGGEYFSAKNANALNKAIKTIAKKVEKPKELDINVDITTYLNGKKINSQEIAIFKDDNKIKSSIHRDNMKLKLSDGVYKVVAKSGYLIATKEFNATKSKLLTIKLEYKGAKLSFGGYLNGKLISSRGLEVYKKGEKKAFSGSAYREKYENLLPEGEYTIKVFAGNLSASKDIYLKAGENQDIKLEYKGAKLYIGFKGEGLNLRDISIFDKSGKRVLNTIFHNDIKGILPIGEYRVVAREHKTGKEMAVDIALKEGENIDLKIDFKPGDNNESR